MSVGLIAALRFFTAWTPFLTPPLPTLHHLASFNASLGSRPPLLGQAYSHPVALLIFRAPAVSSLSCRACRLSRRASYLLCVCYAPPLRETPSSAGLHYIWSPCGVFTMLGSAFCSPVLTMTNLSSLRLGIHGPHPSKPGVFAHNPLYLIDIPQKHDEPWESWWEESRKLQRSSP